MATEDEATSKLKVWRSAAYRKGTDTQLLNIKSGAHPTNLFILSGDRFEASKAFRAGDLSVRIIRLSGNPVSMVTCMVGDHQWMLAKDSMVLRVGPRSFVFALPGLLYGLALPAGGQMEQRLEMLEEIFGSFCAYQDLVAKDGSKLDDLKPEPDNWANAYTKILTLAAEASAKISTTSLTPKSSSTSSSSDSSSSDSTLKKIQRAVRMSAAIKLLSRALLSGSLIPGNHLHVSVAPGAVHTYPTMWAIADILDAIEAGKSPLSRVRREVGVGFWGVKEEGLGVLVDVVKFYGGVRKRGRVVEAAESGGGKRREVTYGGSGDVVMGEEAEKRVAGACGKYSS